MSDKASIDIQFDGNGTNYKAGDRISGLVNITAREKLSCKKIIVELLWMTHGRGNTDQQVIDKIEDPKVDISPHSYHSVKFNFTIPKTPVTYHGTLLNIDYYIRVKLDIPWAFDPVKSREILVLPGDPKDYKPYDYMNREFNPKVIQINSRVLTAIFIILGAIFIFAFWWLAIIFGLFFLIKFLMKAYAEKQLGKVIIESGNGLIVPGSKLILNIRFIPKTTIILNGIHAELNGSESVTSGSGKNAKNHTQDLFKQKFDFNSDLSCHAGIEKNFTQEIQIPDIKAWSFLASSNKVKWWIDVHIDIPGSPDWKEQRAVYMTV
jgi:hypothetical protein